VQLWLHRQRVKIQKYKMVSSSIGGDDDEVGGWIDP